MLISEQRRIAWLGHLAKMRGQTYRWSKGAMKGTSWGQKPFGNVFVCMCVCAFLWENMCFHLPPANRDGFQRSSQESCKVICMHVCLQNLLHFIVLLQLHSQNVLYIIDVYFIKQINTCIQLINAWERFSAHQGCLYLIKNTEKY